MTEEVKRYCGGCGKPIKYSGEEYSSEPIPYSGQERVTCTKDGKIYQTFNQP